MKNLLRYAKWMALPLALLLPLGAAEPGITRKQADDILNELRQIRQLLEKQQSAATPPQAEPVIKAMVSVEGAPSIGAQGAPITMVEFTDFQCPFCQRFHMSTYPEIKKNFIDTGKVRFVSRDLPLDIHPNAMQAAQAGRCAGEQNQFWPMRDKMGANPEQLDMTHLLAYAQEFKLNMDTFRTCMESGKYKAAIQKDVEVAMAIGANGTPSFVLGKSTKDGVDGELVIGALPYQAFDQKLKELAQ
ncbi:MAG: DsbA family protein [Acidobacteriia bacterium]|nr:DsbA family protein [Terriglobia bacterium]